MDVSPAMDNTPDHDRILSGMVVNSVLAYRNASNTWGKVITNPTQLREMTQVHQRGVDASYIRIRLNVSLLLGRIGNNVLEVFFRTIGEKQFTGRHQDPEQFPLSSSCEQRL